MLTDRARQAQMMAAGGAFSVHMCLAVTEAVVLTAEKLGDATRQPQKEGVFPSAACRVLRKETEKVENKQDSLRDREGDVPDKKPDNKGEKQQNIKEFPERIGAVPPDHKARKA